RPSRSSARVPAHGKNIRATPAVPGPNDALPCLLSPTVAHAPATNSGRTGTENPAVQRARDVSTSCPKVNFARESLPPASSKRSPDAVLIDALWRHPGSVLHHRRQIARLGDGL